MGESQGTESERLDKSETETERLDETESERRVESGRVGGRLRQRVMVMVMSGVETLSRSLWLILKSKA